MPELPEVETMRRGLAEAVGCRITGVEATPCGLKPIRIAPGIGAFRRRCVGREITGTSRLGKRVVLELAGEERILFEPRMTGLVLLAAPPNETHLRFRLSLAAAGSDKPRELLYWDRRGLGSVRLASQAEVERLLGAGRLGPDALGLSGEAYAARLGGSRRAIKPALLDQRAVAGIGNLYAAEILHRSGLHPETRCDEIRAAEWDRLAAAAEEILEQAIRYEGSTLSDGTYRNALNEAGGYQNHHQVYDREGKTCPSCRREAIVRFVQAQRATFYCPHCQPRVRRGRRAQGRGSGRTKR